MFDICFINFADSELDARVNNMVSALLNQGKSILLISLKNTKISNPNLLQIQIEVKQNASMVMKLAEFSYKIHSQNISARFIVACDVYSLYPASVLKKRNNALLVYDSREIYSALGSLNENKFKQSLLAKYERYFIKFVQKIIVTGELDKQYLMKYFKNHSEYFLIMNLPYFKIKENNDKIREKLNISKNKKIILYQGWLLNGRGIEILFELIKKIEDFVLVLIGEGEQKSKFIQSAGNLLNNKIFFLDAVPYEQLHSITCSADLGAALFEPLSLSYNLALPNKLFEFAMAEIPIIASDLPAIRNIYSEFEFGELIPTEFNLDIIISQIHKIINSKNDYVENIKKMKSKYNYNNQIYILNQIFEVN